MKTPSRFLFGAAALLMVAGCKEENVAREVTAVEEESAEEAKARTTAELEATAREQTKIREEIDSLTVRQRQATRDLAILERSKAELEEKLVVVDAAKQEMDRTVKTLSERWINEVEVFADGCFVQPLGKSFADMGDLLNKTLQENKELKEKLEKLEGK